MSGSIVLTDGAKFKCAHMPVPLGVSEGITISLTASKVTVNGAKPILNGAVISGFTTCTHTEGLVQKPCTAFKLTTVPATGLLTASNQKVYIAADKSAISSVPSEGNKLSGLTIIESQTQLKA